MKYVAALGQSQGLDRELAQLVVVRVKSGALPVLLLAASLKYPLVLPVMGQDK